MMNRQSTILFFFFVAVAAVLTGCREDPPLPEPPCEHYAWEIQDWMYFEEGTYWVYEEQTTGAIDCVYVTSAVIKDPGNVGQEKSPYIDVRMYSTHNGYYYYDYLPLVELDDECYPCARKEPFCFDITREKYKTGEYFGAHSTFLFYPNPGSVRLWVLNAWDNDTTRIIDSLIIPAADSLQFNVVKIWHSDDDLKYRQESYYYYARYFGLIRKELSDSNEVWTLKRFNIV